jgi:hypothetical protein
VGFGGFLTGLNALVHGLDGLDGPDRDWPAIATTAITEIGFPIGCAILTYVGQVVAQSFGEIEKGSVRV